MTFLTPEEAAPIIKCERNSFYRSLKNGEIPEDCIKRVGKGKKPRILINKERFEKWLSTPDILPSVDPRRSHG